MSIARMKNAEIAKILYEIADFLEIEKIPFKPAAYRKAALALKNLEEDVGVIYRRDGEKGVEGITGVGKSIASKIVEYLESGRIQYYEKYKKKYPIEIENLAGIEGIGAKTAWKLFRELGIRNINDLERAVKKGKIRNLAGFGEKSEKNILQSLEFFRRHKGRFLLGEVMPKVKEIEKIIRGVKGVETIQVCGSVRRMSAMVGDVDFLVVAENPSPVMDKFCALPGITKIWGRGKTKSSVHFQEGFDADIRVVPKNSYGAALQYFTGNKAHNIKLRKIAIKKGYKLNEYGLFKGKKRLAGRTEEEIYQKLGLRWMPPEIRLNQGEIDASIRGELPKLIEPRDIKGDLHVHSRWNGGADEIKELAEAALEMGYVYIGISDHTKVLKIENGIDEKALSEQRKEIDKINRNFERNRINFRILQGAEVNILEDGTIDIDDAALKKLDYAIGGIHSHLKMGEKEMTKRLIKAMENPHINIIAHPTGRILKLRAAYSINFEALLQKARETGTILEVDACPERLDLDGAHIRKTIEAGVKIIISTDTHQKSQLRNMELGVGQARRGWAEKKDVVNSLPLDKLIQALQKGR